MADRAAEIVLQQLRELAAACPEERVPDRELLARFISGHDGLAANDKIENVTVKWPGGEEQEWSSLKVDRYWRLVEGEKEAKSAGGATKQP